MINDVKYVLQLMSNSHKFYVFLCFYLIVILFIGIYKVLIMYMKKDKKLIKFGVIFDTYFE